MPQFSANEDFDVYPRNAVSLVLTKLQRPQTVAS
jgi:pantothenate synthetase